jgi:hypothetical protein
MVTQLARAGQAEDADALEEAERLGDAAETVAADGRLAERPAELDADGARLGWHALGAVVAATIACPGCGARYRADDEAAEVPRCPACGVPDTWESRQDAPFRALVAGNRRLPVAHRSGGARQAALRSGTAARPGGCRLDALPATEGGAGGSGHAMRRGTRPHRPHRGGSGAGVAAAGRRTLPNTAGRRGDHAGGVAARVARLPGAPAARRVGRRRHERQPAREEAIGQRSQAGGSPCSSPHGLARSAREADQARAGGDSPTRRRAMYRGAWLGRDAPLGLIDQRTARVPRSGSRRQACGVHGSP